MNGTILSKLDVSINKVNRFISTSVSLKKTYKEYEKIFHSITLATKKDILNVSGALSESAFPNLTYKKTKSFDDFVISLEKIFSHRKILLGDKKITQETIKKILVHLQKVYEKRQKLVFTLLGYPYKMPNPLYTNSTSVDLAEIISIYKLHHLISKLNEIYPYGVKLIILTENSIFNTMSDISNENQIKYFHDLCKWKNFIDKSGTIEIRDIKDYHTVELEKKWRELEKEMEKRYWENDPLIKDKVEAVMPTNFMTLNYRKFKPEFLIRYFNPECKDVYIEGLRRKNYGRALKESFYYLSYHQARYELGFMDAVFPNTFRLTVAPKVGSLAINMLNEKSKILPYYGYIVKKGGDFKMEYIVDVPKKAKSIYWEGNLEYPFYYEI